MLQPSSNHNLEMSYNVPRVNLPNPQQPLGGLAIEFSNGLRLEIFPDASRAEHDDWEYWRLFERDRAHYVVSSDGSALHG